MTESDPPDTVNLRAVRDEAMKAMEEQQENLAEVTRVWREETTTVTAKNHSLSVTLDGRGELTGLTFHGKKYRSMPPLQLASVILETIQQGRSQSMEKLAQSVQPPSFPGMDGLDMSSIASGSADPQEMLNKLLKPMLSGFDEIVPKMFGDTRSDDSGKRRSDG